MRTLASYSTPAEAQVIWSRLNSAGVDAVIRDELTVGSLWMYSNAVGGVKIEVVEDDYEDACELLNLLPEEAGIIRCPHCKGIDCRVRPLDAFGAICIVLKLPIPMKRAIADCRRCGKSHDVPINGQGAGGTPPSL
jgi:hypothetical protein